MLFFLQIIKLVLNRELLGSGTGFGRQCEQGNKAVWLHCEYHSHPGPGPLAL